MSETYLLNTITAWSETVRARHQVALALAAHDDVVFVARSVRGVPGLELRQVADRLTVVTPSWPVDYRLRYRLPLLNEHYQRWLFPRLRKRFPAARMVNFDHTAALVGRYFAAYVYYCNDHHIGNSPWHLPLLERYQLRCEAAVARGAAVCVGTSAFLVAKLGRWTDHVEEIPLGAPEIAPDLLAGAPLRWDRQRPVLGLAGSLGPRVPPALLQRLVAEVPARLLLCGPAPGDYLEQLGGDEHIVHRGLLHGEALHRAMLEIDVGIAPYDVRRVNPGGTPNKLWLYLAAGKPAVVTDLPGIRHWTFPPGCVYRATDADGFVAAVRQALAEDGPEARERRLAVARENSWARRMDHLRAALNRQEHTPT